MREQPHPLLPYSRDRARRVDGAGRREPGRGVLGGGLAVCASRPARRWRPGTSPPASPGRSACWRRHGDDAPQRARRAPAHRARARPPRSSTTSQTRGLVERRPDPADRRATLVALTEEGDRVSAAIRAARRAEADRFFGRPRRRRPGRAGPHPAHPARLTPDGFARTAPAGSQRPRSGTGPRPGGARCSRGATSDPEACRRLMCGISGEARFDGRRPTRRRSPG